MAINKLYFSPKQHKLISIMDESKLHETELKAKSSGMLLEYEEDDYDSGIIVLYCASYS
jgi:hypothetical protein